jgi:hypothetical protein
MAGEIKHKISKQATYILIGLAGIADIFTFIPFVGDFVGWIFWIIMSVVFWKLGLGLVNYRKLTSMLISTAIEFIPFVQMLPSITAAMAAIIFFSRIEEKTGLKILPTKTKPGITRPNIRKAPLNSQSGIRQPRNIVKLEQPVDEGLDIAA